MTYRVFRRSANNWREFSTARKYTIWKGVQTAAEARDLCAQFNDHRNAQQIEAGTKYEFVKE